jgi:AraC family transcriptional regulator
MKILGLTLLLIAVVSSAVNGAAGAEAEQATRIHLKHTEPQNVAAMRHQGPYTDIPAVAQNLMSAIGEGGYHQAGPIMAMYLNDPRQTAEADLLCEVWIPVAYPGPIGTAENDNMVFRHIDPMFVVYTYHIGPFDEVESSYGELLGWAARNQYPIMGAPVEIYWSNPEIVPEDQLVTEIWFPVKEKTLPGIVGE